MPNGCRNSSNSISPGWVGGRWVGNRRCTRAATGARLVVVRDFDVVGIAVLPSETDPILFVDANAVLATTRTTEQFQTITRRNRQLRQFAYPIQLREFPCDHSPERLRAC